MSSYLDVKKSLKKYGLIFANQLLDHHGECFTWNTFHRWKRLSSRSFIPTWFVSVSDFIKCSGLSNNIVVACHFAPGNIACNTGFVFEWLLASKHGSIEVYMDGSVKGLGSIDACGSAAAYFPKANVSIDVRVFGLLSSTLVELQAIALVLECIPNSSMVILFMNSQTLLDICKFEVGGFGSDFQHKSWIKKKHICQAILNKNLSVTWRKVKGHSGVIGNEHADFFANTESKFSTNIVDANFAGNIDSFKSFSLIFCFSINLLYKISASSPAGRHKEKIDSDHLFLCKHDNTARLNILSVIGVEWCKMTGVPAISDAVLCLSSASGDSLIVKLMSAVKLRAFYEKHNFLPYDRLAMLLIKDLSELWNAGIIHDFGFRLDIYMCFSLHSCLTRLDFGFLNSISLTVPACS
ncbi:hypothetical protein G9A89_012048 [Geosiphon pyriformis]|nr:hypothetical protein G9A89_012048 [Geosiphon pyriformis]